MSKALNNGNPGKTVYQFSVLFYGADGRPSDIKHFKAREGEFLVIKTDWHDPSINYATAEDYKKLGELMPPAEMLEAEFKKGETNIRARMRPQRMGNPEDTRLANYFKSLTDEMLSLYRFDFENNADMHNFFERVRDIARKAIDLLDSARLKERADQRAASALKKAFTCHSDCKHYPDMEEPYDDIAMWPEPCQLCRRHKLLRDEYSTGEEAKA